MGMGSADPCGAPCKSNSILRIFFCFPARLQKLVFAARRKIKTPFAGGEFDLVGVGGFEPPTSTSRT